MPPLLRVLFNLFHKMLIYKSYPAGNNAATHLTPIWAVPFPGSTRFYIICSNVVWPLVSVLSLWLSLSMLFWLSFLLSRFLQWFILLVKKWQRYLCGVDDKDDNVTQDLECWTKEMDMMRLDLAIEYLWKLCQNACKFYVSNEDLLIIVRKQNLCLISLVPISFCTHPSFTAQITRVFTVLASKRGIKCFHCFKKAGLDPPGTWILIGALILLGGPSCQSHASQRNVSQPLTASMGGPTAVSTKCLKIHHLARPMSWTVPCKLSFNNYR